MAPPQSHSAIESAIIYAEHHPNYVTISPQFAEHQKARAYERILSEVDTIDKLIALQERLEQDMPYFQLGSNAQIAAYFSRWHVPIESGSDLTLFSGVLAQKVAEAAKANTTVQVQVANKAYHRQLRELPSAISRLEKTLEGFNSFVAPFDAVMRYVHEAVTRQGFSMHEDGIKATEQYEATVILSSLEKNQRVVKLQIDITKRNKLVLYLHPTYKTKITKTAARISRLTLPFKKTRRVETDEVDAFQILPLQVSDFTWKENQTFGPHFLSAGNLCTPACTEMGIVVMTPQQYVHALKAVLMKNPEMYAQSLQAYLNIIFNLPKYMHHYAERTQRAVTSFLDQLSAEMQEK